MSIDHVEACNGLVRRVHPDVEEKQKLDQPACDGQHQDADAYAAVGQEPLNGMKIIMHE